MTITSTRGARTTRRRTHADGEVVRLRAVDIPERTGNASPPTEATGSEGRGESRRPGETKSKGACTVKSAAGEEVTIPAWTGDGVEQIREMRGPIIRANIAKALDGSYLHMKSLFEYAGLWPAEAPAEEDDSSFAALLLRKLEAEEKRGKAEGNG